MRDFISVASMISLLLLRGQRTRQDLSANISVNFTSMSFRHDFSARGGSVFGGRPKTGIRKLVDPRLKYSGMTLELKGCAFA